MPAPDERDLVQRAREGDHVAFRVLVESHMKQAYAVAYGFVNNHDDAEDVAQEAFVRIYGALKSFRGDSEFSTWMYRIVTNLALNKVKQRKRLERHIAEGPVMEHMLVAPEPSHNDHLDLKMNVERALHQLPTLQRAVVILRHLDGLSTRQVSQILRVSEGTVKTHLHRGLKKMRVLLQVAEKEMV